MTDAERKNAVAKFIFDRLPIAELARFLDDGTIVSTEWHSVSRLEGLIRVKTRQQGTHYYRLKLSEQW